MNSFFEPKFAEAAWLDKSAGSLRYFGNKVRFQNGLGGWQIMRYTCDVDPLAETVIAGGGGSYVPARPCERQRGRG